MSSGSCRSACSHIRLTEVAGQTLCGPLVRCMHQYSGHTIAATIRRSGQLQSDYGFCSSSWCSSTSAVLIICCTQPLGETREKQSKLRKLRNTTPKKIDITSRQELCRPEAQCAVDERYGQAKRTLHNARCSGRDIVHEFEVLKEQSTLMEAGIG